MTGPTIEQRRWLTSVLGHHEIVEDLSWPGSPSSVWSVADSSNRSFVVKVSAGAMKHHIAREIDAHETVVPSLAATEDAQPFVAASRDLGMLVVGRLPGELVAETDAATDPRTHHDAGALLVRIHGAERPVPETNWRTDHRYEAVQNEQIRRWLAATHRIPLDRQRAVEAVLDRQEHRPVTVVPTHGDWQPRNWLIDARSGRVRVIDFGRFAWRPAQTDLVRCWSNEWRDRPELEAAHLDGYGGDPRDDTWPLECLRQAVSTAAWAHQMGDEAFEQHGLDMIDRVLG